MRLRLLFSFVALVVASLAFSQGIFRPTVSHPEYNTSLLMNPAAQRELHLSPSVAMKIKGMMDATNRKLAESMRMKPGAVDGKKMQANRVSMMAQLNSDRTRTLAMLSATQKKRLKEMSLQAFGGAAVLLPTVSNELGITKAQTSSIQKLISAHAKESMALYQKATSKGAMDMIARSQKLKEKMDRDVLAVLTPSQRKVWTAMLGKPFRMTMTGAPGRGVGQTKG